MPPFRNIEVGETLCSIPRAFQFFHSTVDSAGYRSAGELRSRERHCIFHYTVRGHGEVVYRGKAFQTNPGEGFFNIINEAGSGYGYPAAAVEPWEFVVVCFDGGNVREVTQELLEHSVVYDLKPNQSVFCAMCRRLLEEVNQDAALTFLPRLVALIHESCRPVTQLSVRFQEIVERDLMKNPTIQAIADELRISREHLHREFLRQTGTTPARYLSNKRFERLCQLLISSATEVEICRMMHFPSVSGMSLFFKKHAGVTPRQYRRNGYLSI